jgi:hypothetical protein
LQHQLYGPWYHLGARFLSSFSPIALEAQKKGMIVHVVGAPELSDFSFMTAYVLDLLRFVLRIFIFSTINLQGKSQIMAREMLELESICKVMPLRYLASMTTEEAIAMIQARIKNANDSAISLTPPYTLIEN